MTSRRFVPLVLVTALLLSGTTRADLLLDVNAGPDPARRSEMLDLEITVINTGPDDRTDITVLLDFPAGLATLFSTTFPGTCPGGSCQAGEQATFTIASLPAGRGTSFLVPARIAANAADGLEIPFDTAVWDDGVMQHAATDNVIVNLDRSIELALVADRDPVTPGMTLTCVITYGVLSTSPGSPDAAVTLPVPSGATFLSATHGGALSEGIVTWELGNLNAGSVGEVRAAFRVDEGLGATAFLTTAASYVDSAGETVRHPAAVRRETTPGLLVGVDASPDPARPNETMDVQVTITNAGPFSANGVVLEVVTPDDVGTLFSTWFEGDCAGGSCQSGEPAIFNVGTVPAGKGATFTMPFRVTNGTLDGTVVTFNASLRDASDQRRESSATTAVGAARALEIAVIEDRDPVVPDETIHYSINYGLIETAPGAIDATLAVPVPSGTTFVAADRGGMLVDGVVTWELGNLDPGTTGERGVTFHVDAGATPGTFLPAEATFADANGRVTRHGTLTRIEEATPLQFTITASPDPARPGETLDVEFTVTNRGVFDRTGVTFDVEITDHFNTLFDTLFDGVCPGGSCQPQERATINLGTVPAGKGRSFTMPFVVANGTPRGTVIPIEATVRDNPGDRRDAGASLAVDGGRYLELTVVETDEPVEPGGRLAYTLTYGVLATSGGAANAELRFPLPAGTTFESATDGGGLVGDDVVWALGDVGPGAGGDRHLVVTVDADFEGDVVAGEVRFETSGTGVRQGTTTVISSNATELDVEINANPNPADPNETLDVELSVTNNSAFTQANVVLRVEFTDHLSTLFDGQHDGNCPGGSCQPGERIVFMVPLLAAGETVVFPIPPVVAGTTTAGTVVRFDACASDSTGRHSRDRDAFKVGPLFDRARGGDISEDGLVGFADILIVLASWGPCPDPDDCPEDADGDGEVGFSDVLMILANWG